MRVLAGVCLALLVGCSVAAPSPRPTPHLEPSQRTYVEPSQRTIPPSPAEWAVGQRYPFAISTHCGITALFPVRFDGSDWLLAAGNGMQLPRGMQQEDFGTMQLQDHQHAIYRSENGPILELKRESSPLPTDGGCM